MCSLFLRNESHASGEDSLRQRPRMTYRTIFLEKSNNVYRLALCQPEVLDAPDEQIKRDSFRTFDVVVEDNEARPTISNN